MPVFLLKRHDPEHTDDENTFTVKPFLKVTFNKVFNNTGAIRCKEGDIAQKMLAFAHFTLDKYHGNAMATDLQGIID